MKCSIIGIDNVKFEANIVRWFRNVNDYYLIFDKNEIDANGYVILYAIKIHNDNGIKIGEDITNNNEWELIKNFLHQTVKQNKEGTPVTIDDCNPFEIQDVKINSQKVFKLAKASVELFAKNQKNFDIVQKEAEMRRVVQTPIAPETVGFYPKKEEEIEKTKEEITENNVEEKTVEESKEETTENDVEEKTVEESKEDFEKLYKEELNKNEELTKEIEQLIKDNSEYKEKLDKIKELV